MDELLLDNNKERIYKILQFDISIPENSIRDKIKTSSYSYLVTIGYFAASMFKVILHLDKRSQSGLYAHFL